MSSADVQPHTFHNQQEKKSFSCLKRNDYLVPLPCSSLTRRKRPFPTVYCWTMNTRLICLADPFQSPLFALTADFTSLMSQHFHLFPNAKQRPIPPLEMLVSPPLAACVAASLSAHTKRQLFHRQQSQIQRPAGPVVWSSKFQITALWMKALGKEGGAASLSSPTTSSFPVVPFIPSAWKVN